MSIHKYNTIHYNNILEYITNNSDNLISSNDIIEHFNKQNIKIGVSTVYRVLNNLVNEDIIRKEMSSDKNQSYYQFINSDCHLHYHFKCDICNKLFHINCSNTNSFVEHINKTHGFSINLFNSMLKGTCNKCKGA